MCVCVCIKITRDVEKYGPNMFITLLEKIKKDTSDNSSTRFLLYIDVMGLYAQVDSYPPRNSWFFSAFFFGFWFLQTSK